MCVLSGAETGARRSLALSPTHGACSPIPLKHTVTTAENGREAMECLNEGVRIDLVLTDMLMPEVRAPGGGAEGRRRGEPADDASR